LSVEGGEIPSIGGEEGPPVHPQLTKKVTALSVPFVYSSALAHEGIHCGSDGSGSTGSQDLAAAPVYFAARPEW